MADKYTKNIVFNIGEYVVSVIHKHYNCINVAGKDVIFI